MHAHKFTTRFLFTTILALPACLFAQVKDTIVIKTPVTVQQPILDRISRLPSLADFTHQLGTQFEYELNETGNFAVVNITSNLKMSNYIGKLQQGTGEFEKSGVKAKKTPTHYLEPSVTRFEEVINTISNPLNGDRVVNKDLAVTITVFVRSFSDQTDNKQFRASKEATWNETIFNNNARTRNESLGKIEAFAKSVAKEMATNFLAPPSFLLRGKQIQQHLHADRGNRSRSETRGYLRCWTGHFNHTSSHWRETWGHSSGSG